MSAPELTWITGIVGAVLLLGALAGAVAAITNRVRAGVVFMRRMDQFLRDWFGEPADPQRGAPRRPGMPERMGAVEGRFGEMCGRMTTVEHQVADIAGQLHPNGGSSLRDAVDRIARTTAPHSEE